MSGKRGWKSVKLVLKLALAAIVLLAVSRQAVSAFRELSNQGEALSITPAWLVASAAAYLLGLASCAWYYALLLKNSPTPIGTLPASRAYFISHLGKYVPGKAMVVVLRSVLSASAGARPATAAIATLYETLVMMAAGGLIAALGFSLGRNPRVALALGPLGNRNIPLALLGLLAGLAFLAIVLPPCFKRIIALVTLPFPNTGPDTLHRLDGTTLAVGLILASAGWLFLGCSQLAVLYALLPSGVPPATWPTVVASVAFATVAGFAVPVSPGGLGVREWVLWSSLASVLDHNLAVVAALLLRLTWVVAELLASAILFPLRSAPHETAAP